LDGHRNDTCRENVSSGHALAGAYERTMIAGCERHPDVLRCTEMWERIIRWLRPGPKVYRVRPEAKESDYPHPVGSPPDEPIGHWVFLSAVYCPADLVFIEGNEKYFPVGEEVFQCVSIEAPYVVVRNKHREYRVNPDRVIWIPTPRFQRGECVRTLVGSANDIGIGKIGDSIITLM
jgi:hypothetical protein